MVHQVGDAGDRLRRQAEAGDVLGRVSAAAAPGSARGSRRCRPSAPRRHACPPQRACRRRAPRAPARGGSRRGRGRAMTAPRRGSRAAPRATVTGSWPAVRQRRNRHHPAMEFADVLRRRKMVRSYTDEPVDREAVERIVARGRKAPSGGFSQGVRMVVVTDAGMRAQIAELAREPEYVKLGLEPWISQRAGPHRRRHARGRLPRPLPAAGQGRGETARRSSGAFRGGGSTPASR